MYVGVPVDDETAGRETRSYQQPASGGVNDLRVCRSPDESDVGNISNSVNLSIMEAAQFPPYLLSSSSGLPLVKIDALVIDQHELAFTGRSMGNFDELVDAHELSAPRFTQLQAGVRVEEEMPRVCGNDIHEVLPLANVPAHQTKPEKVGIPTWEGLIWFFAIWGEIHRMDEPFIFGDEPA